MKRLLHGTILTIALICTGTFMATAQEKGDFAIGLSNSLYTHTGHGAKYGIGIYARYNFSDGLRIEPAISYVCGKKCSLDISADVQYTFDIGREMWLYPILGVGVNEINRWSASLNIGMGYDWAITHNWILSCSIKYMIQTADHKYLRNPFVPKIGIGYRF